MKRSEIISQIDVDESLLLEMATVGRVFDKHTKRQYIITIDAESTRIGNPYFKIYNSSSVSRASEVARISMLHPRLIYHSDGRYDSFILNRGLLRRLMLFFNEPSPVPGLNNWKNMIFLYNQQNSRAKDRTKLMNATSIEIEANPNDFKNTLPMDLPIPNYIEL